jgi:hypothetical protein
LTSFFPKARRLSLWSRERSGYINLVHPKILLISYPLSRVHLYGNYIQQNPDEDDEDEDSDEGDFDLDEVPSDIELGLEDDDEAGDSR